METHLAGISTDVPGPLLQLDIPQPLMLLWPLKEAIIAFNLISIDFIP